MKHTHRFILTASLIFSISLTLSAQTTPDRAVKDNTLRSLRGVVVQVSVEAQGFTPSAELAQERLTASLSIRLRKAGLIVPSAIDKSEMPYVPMLLIAINANSTQTCNVAVVSVELIENASLNRPARTIIPVTSWIEQSVIFDFKSIISTANALIDQFADDWQGANLKR